MIIETYQLSATNADVLAAPSRLAAVPYDGIMTLEMQASAMDGTNQYNVTVQLPGGDVPMDGVPIPDGATDNALNADDKFVVAFAVAKGGHVLINAVESGTATMIIRATLSP